MTNMKEYRDRFITNWNNATFEQRYKFIKEVFDSQELCDFRELDSGLQGLLLRFIEDGYDDERIEEILS